MISPTIFAIIDSSFVCITRTVTLAVAKEIISPLVLFFVLSISIPKNWSPWQILSRTSGMCSPIPPENIKVSTPPRAALKEPIHFLA